MAYTSVTIDTARIGDWDSFHTVFAEAFGFPGFYGRNMNAWAECLESLDDPDDTLTTIKAPPGGVVVLALLNVRDLAARCPEIYAVITECAAFVNHCKIDVGEQPVLCLSFFYSDPNASGGGL